LSHFKASLIKIRPGWSIVSFFHTSAASDRKKWSVWSRKELKYFHSGPCNRKKRTAEYRTRNRRISKCGIASLWLFHGYKDRKNTFLRHWTFLVRYWIFAFLQVSHERHLWPEKMVSL